MKKYLVLSGVAVAALGLATPLLAQEREERMCYAADDEATPDEELLCFDGEEILVSGSRSERVALDDFPGSVSIIDSEEMRLHQIRDVADALRDRPSVAVGAIPGQTQLRLRGSEANHVLVLVDGIEVSDPFAGEFDIGLLQGEIGARAELLLGPQSALYGSDAIGGAFAYYSPTGCEGPLDAYAEGGTSGTLNASARAGACEDWGNFNVSATLFTTNGQPNVRGGARDLGRDAYTLSAKGEIPLTDALTIRGAGRFVRSVGDFNDQDFDPVSPTFGFVVDTPETTYEIEGAYALVGANLSTLGDAWTHDLSFQVADTMRNTFGPFGRTFGSEGERIKASYVSTVAIQGDFDHGITFAADWEEERYRNTDPFGFAFTGTRRNKNIGLVGEYRFDAESFGLSAAVRHDFNDLFADATTYKLAARFDVTDTMRLRGSYGTGIKNPGFYELYGFVDGRFIGNENLRPEKATGWEIGIDQSLLGDRVQASAVYFESELDGEIFTSFSAPTFIATPANRDTVSIRRGVELGAMASLTSGLTLNAAYTWLDAEEDGVTEVRRPGNRATASLDWTAPGDRASASLVVRHNGSSEDLAFTDPSFVPVRVTLDPYTLVNIYGEVKLGKSFSVFGRAENLLDERYEDVFSFVAPGRQFVAGVRADF